MGAPSTMSRPKFSSPRLAAAAKGPGVGGISVCAANKPVDRAMVSASSGTFERSESSLLSDESMTKAESQKTGIETT